MFIVVAGEGFLLDALYKLKGIVWRLPVSSRRNNKYHWGSLLLQIVLEPVMWSVKRLASPHINVKHNNNAEKLIRQCHLQSAIIMQLCCRINALKVRFKICVLCNSYLCIVVQAAKLSDQSMLLRHLGDPLSYRLGLALLRPVQKHEPRLHSTRHAAGARFQTGLDISNRLQTETSFFSVDLFEN